MYNIFYAKYTPIRIVLWGPLKCANPNLKTAPIFSRYFLEVIGTRPPPEIDSCGPVASPLE